jgi:ribonucleoside-diphosphate reductase alpha chain
MLPSLYQQYIHQSRYARYLPEVNRRETWEETVTRYCDFFLKKYPDTFPAGDIYDAIVNLEVMPSMRAMMTAGPALERDNVAGYNCSYKSIDHPRVFDEIMYILMCGTGVGFSVERQFVNKLPEVADEFHETETTIIVADSKIGWASAFRELISLLYAGKVPKWDMSRVRQAGERLKTFGGRASGPAPLEELFTFCVRLFRNAQGRRLNSLECHDLVCKIADVVVVGGVRRSALISLSNLTDERMQRAKTGTWWESEPQRALANNSVAYTEKPDLGIFMREWQNLYESRAGERGIFNRQAAIKKVRSLGTRDPEHQFGTNPCDEIILRDGGFCNLSEIVCRPDDTLESLKKKVEMATIIGTFQATLTDFRYLRPLWKKNADEERLLGVSLTGIQDCGILFTEGTLRTLREHAHSTNKRWASILGIAPSAAITCVKPSGTVSQLVDSASGIHPRFAPYYLRRVRADKKDPLAIYMVAQGFPVEDDVTKPDNTYVFTFPVKAPEEALFERGATSAGQLSDNRYFNEEWADHLVSQTVYYTDSDFLTAGAWVYKNFDNLTGVSFLPKTDHIYKQAPYEEITEAEFVEWQKKIPDSINWQGFVEEEDHTSASQELACTGNLCEIN